MGQKDEREGVVSGASFTDAQFDRLIQALTAQKSGGLDADTLKTILQESAKATQKAMRPENEAHPGISDFNPEGERDNPNPQLECDTYYRGFPIHKSWETHTRQELSLLNEVQGGVFTVLRKDFQPMRVEVAVDRDPAGKSIKKEVKFDVSREERHYIPSMVSVLLQAVNREQLTPKQAYIQAMRAELDRLTAQDAVATK